MTNKLISNEDEWARVADELKAEKVKLAFYDNTVISLLGKVKEKKILDYGGGPGVLPLALKKLGANVKEYDISEDLLKQAAEKIGENNIYHNFEDIPGEEFDIIICNLVLCIVSEDEVKRIVRKIKDSLTTKGFAFIGFCNPKLIDVPETNLDLRPVPKHKYEENHSYMKTKKEGGYQIIENHRPIEWYKKVYEENELKLVDIFFTPEYELNGRKIKDFIIFKLAR